MTQTLHQSKADRLRQKIGENPVDEVEISFRYAKSHFFLKKKAYFVYEKSIILTDDIDSFICHLSQTGHYYDLDHTSVKKYVVKDFRNEDEKIKIDAGKCIDLISSI